MTHSGLSISSSSSEEGAWLILGYPSDHLLRTGCMTHSGYPSDHLLRRVHDS